MIDALISSFAPISLTEMKSVKLMNRIDTKYVIPLSLLPAVLEAAQMDYRIQENDGVRKAVYDTLYYDTVGLDMYVRHHNRHLTRQKIRVREYVSSNEFFLEIKRKNNHGRTKKKRIAIPAADALSLSPVMAEFIAEKSQYTAAQLVAQLRTQFERITLVNKALTERLTIDVGLHWYNEQTEQTAALPELVIIELKRDGNTPSPMLHILRDLRIKPFKISKYCIGTVLTNPNVKANRFKRKIRNIHKIINHDSN